MRIKIFSISLCTLLALASARAEWQVVASEHESVAGKAATYWHTAVSDTEADRRAELDLVIFSPRTAALRVVDEPRSEQSLAQLMERSNFLAGVNGGYFDPEGNPVGLLVSDGKVVSRLQRRRLLSGVLAARDSMVEIVRTNQFAMSRKIEAAVQCGPLLIEKRRLVAGLNDVRSARRTFAAISRSGPAMLGTCSEVSLAQLARVLSLEGIAGQTRIDHALNLDGGSSSAFWCRRENGEPVSIPELKSVRDFVVIAPR